MPPPMKSSPVVLCALALTLALAACSRHEPAPEPVRAVRSIVVAPSSAQPTQEFAAEVKARTEAALSFRVGGKLRTRPVNLGDAVRAGQELAVLDPEDLRLGEQAARAAWNGAKSQRDLAEADFRRFQELHRQGFISAAELQRREATLQSARATADEARAQLAAQGNQTAYARLLADAPGVVTAVLAEPGAVVAAGTPIVRVARDGPRDVVFSVPEDRVGAYRALIGQAGVLGATLWGSDAKRLPATVREVSAAADPATRTFLVKADIGRADARLGQTATVRIVQPAATVLKVPLTAMFASGGRSAVWLVEGEGPERTVRLQPIEVATAIGNEVVVGAGLKPGQRVVTAGTHVLTAGQKVRLYEAAAAAAAPASGASR